MSDAGWTTRQPTSSHAGAPEEPMDDARNPVAEGLATAEYAHLLGEGAMTGEKEGRSLGELGQNLVAESSEIWEGGGTASQTTLWGSSPVFGALGIGGGMMDIVEGGREWNHGDEANGLIDVFGGTSSVVSGGASFGMLAGSGTAAWLGPAAGAFATGMQIGRFGDQEVAKRGWVHDDQGKSESASQWVADNGVHAHDWVTRHVGNGTLGNIAGDGAAALTMLGSLVPGGAMAFAGATASAGSALARGGERIGDAVANRHRANGYASMSGIDMIKGAPVGSAAGRAEAQKMADADDARRAHENNGPTTLRWIQEMTRDVRAGTHPGEAAPRTKVGGTR